MLSVGAFGRHGAELPRVSLDQTPFRGQAPHIGIAPDEITDPTVLRLLAGRCDLDTGDLQGCSCLVNRGRILKHAASQTRPSSGSLRRPNARASAPSEYGGRAVHLRVRAPIC